MYEGTVNMGNNFSPPADPGYADVAPDAPYEAATFVNDRPSGDGCKCRLVLLTLLTLSKISTSQGQLHRMHMLKRFMHPFFTSY